MGWRHAKHQSADRVCMNLSRKSFLTSCVGLIRPFHFGKIFRQCHHYTVQIEVLLKIIKTYRLKINYLMHSKAERHPKHPLLQVQPIALYHEQNKPNILLGCHLYLAGLMAIAIWKIQWSRFTIRYWFTYWDRTSPRRTPPFILDTSTLLSCSKSVKRDSMPFAASHLHVANSSGVTPSMAKNSRQNSL